MLFYCQLRKRSLTTANNRDRTSGTGVKEIDMKIYVFDDKYDNVEQAHVAISESGHEIPPDYADCGERFQDDNFNRQWCRQHSLALHALRKGLWRARYLRQENMFKMIEHAVEDVKVNGGGIITDLMFHLSTPCDEDHRNQPPAGLLVALHAVAHGVPVVICTNTEEVGGHHAKEISWIYDGYVGRRHSSKCAFGWVEDKDYKKAVAILEERAAR